MKPLLTAALTVWCGLLATAVQAQIPGDYPVVAVTRPGDCEAAPDLFGAPTFTAATGIVDVWIYPIVFADVRGVRLGVTWPEEWILLESEACYGTVVAGGIDGPGSGVTMVLPRYDYDPPAIIRLRLDATFAGRLSLMPDPNSGEFSYQDYHGAWRPYWGADPGRGGTFAYVEIGAHCGFSPMSSTGGFCGLFTLAPPAGLVVGLKQFVALLHGETLSYKMILIPGGQECGWDLPECPYPGDPDPCGRMPTADEPWIAIDPIGGAQETEQSYRVTYDTRELAAGIHTGHVRVPGGCCTPLCYEINLEILPVAVEPATWGRIKARYR